MCNEAELKFSTSDRVTRDSSEEVKTEWGDVVRKVQQEGIALPQIWE